MKDKFGFLINRFFKLDKEQGILENSFINVLKSIAVIVIHGTLRQHIFNSVNALSNNFP